MSCGLHTGHLILWCSLLLVPCPPNSLGRRAWWQKKLRLVCKDVIEYILKRKEIEDLEQWLKAIEQNLSGLKYQPQRFLLNITTPRPSSKNVEVSGHSQQALCGTRLHSSQDDAIIAKSTKSTLQSPLKSISGFPKQNGSRRAP